MYNATRQETSDLLWISVRSVDRYIKAGKLRIKKDGKNIFVHWWDIDAIKNGGKSKHHVIINRVQPKTEKVYTEKTYQNEEPVSFSSTQVSTGKEEASLSHIYLDMKKDIAKKDDVIQTLALRVGKAEEIAKNSISINDFKKSQFLLEESKSVIASELDLAKKQKDTLQKKLNYEKQIKLLLLFLSIALFLTLFFVWIANI